MNAHELATKLLTMPCGSEVFIETDCTPRTPVLYAESEDGEGGGEWIVLVCDDLKVCDNNGNVVGLLSDDPRRKTTTD